MERRFSLSQRSLNSSYQGLLSLTSEDESSGQGSMPAALSSPETTFSASSLLPLTSRNLGDSGTLKRRAAAKRAGTAPTKNAMRHPCEGISRNATREAANHPQAQKLSRMTTFLPLDFRGDSSLTRVAAAGSSPPNPKPVMKRKTISIQYSVANPHRKLPML